MNLIWTTSLRVFPQHCNHHNGMIFGGEMLAQMDLAAAAAVARFLYDSPNGVSEALTVGVDKVTFHKGAKVGDLIIFTATITEVGQKRITVKVNANAEKRVPKFIKSIDSDNIDRSFYSWEKETLVEKMAEGLFHFCAYDMEKGKGTEHGMVLPQKEPIVITRFSVPESNLQPKSDTYSERASGYPEKSVKSYVAMKENFEKRQAESK